MDLFTSLWGHNPSSPRHIVRKVPIRVEPKSFYSNERTFLSWLRMALTLGGVSSAVLGWKKTKDEEEEDDKELIISVSTIRTIYTCMLPLSLLMILYAFFVGNIRRACLKTKRVTCFYDDQYGPIVITSLVIAVLLAIYGCALRDLSKHF